MTKQSIFVLLTLVVIQIGNRLLAQDADLNLNDDICYCEGNSPASILKLDNNWELVLRLREPLNKMQMDFLGIAYTTSQLKLLEAWNIIDTDNNQTYRTRVPILDSLKTGKLRELSKKNALGIVPTIATDLEVLNSYLTEKGRGTNAYSIVFSYVIDGLIWDALEEDGLINKRGRDLQNPFWSGEFWSLYPKRDFYCGTNTLSDQGYAMHMNWNEKGIPLMIPLMSRFDLLSILVEDFISTGKVNSHEVKEVFGVFNIFDNNGNITVPVIHNSPNDKIFKLSQVVVGRIFEFIKQEIDLEAVKDEYDFESQSQALIILYHEMIWDIMDILEAKKIVEKPAVFKNAADAKASDIGDLLFFTIDQTQ